MVACVSLHSSFLGFGNFTRKACKTSRSDGPLILTNLATASVPHSRFITSSSSSLTTCSSKSRKRQRRLHPRRTVISLSGATYNGFCSTATFDVHTHQFGRTASMTSVIQNKGRCRSIELWRANANEKGSSSDGDLDLAVFRFTLGIPGFDDGDLPRVVGIFLGVLLLLNHFLSPGVPTSAQWRSESLGISLATLAMVVPTIGRRLREARRGRASVQPTGGRQVFALRESLSEDAERELAWASYAILRNTATSGIIVWLNGDVLCARGRLAGIPALSFQTLQANTPKGKATLLSELGQGFQKTLERNSVLSGVIAGETEQEYISSAAGSKGLEVVPSSAESLLVQSIQVGQGNESGGSRRKGLLIFVSDEARAYGPKDRSWMVSLANKLESHLLTRDLVV